MPHSPLLRSSGTCAGHSSNVPTIPLATDVEPAHNIVGLISPTSLPHY